MANLEMKVMARTGFVAPFLGTQEEFNEILKGKLVARKELEEDKFNIFVDKEVFLDFVGDDSYLSSDNPKAALKGRYNIDTYVTYYCPIEEFTSEELERLNPLRGIK